ncbi:MAG: hypothetical protein OEM38_09655 [Gammaproteobacteria bacterium]|nr:hypothetical protein [Gammaproteobacteria bacterium]
MICFKNSAIVFGVLFGVLSSASVLADRPTTYWVIGAATLPLSIDGLEDIHLSD